MKNILNKFLAVALAVGFLAACNDQEVESPAGTERYPTATFTTSDNTSSLSEGDVITYTITIDKPSKNDLVFEAAFASDSEADDHDIEVSGGVIPAFATETTLTLTAVQDNIPETESKSVNLEIGVQDIGTRYTLSPSTTNPTINTTLANKNNDASLTVAFEWEDPDHVTDFDLLVEYATGGYSWSADGATGDNPEIDMSIGTQWDADPNAYDGTYHVGFDPYSVPNQLNNYVVRVGHPNGNVEVFEGVIDMATIADDFPVNSFSAWGIPLYTLLTVTKTGNTYAVTFHGN